MKYKVDSLFVHEEFNNNCKTFTLRLLDPSKEEIIKVSKTVTLEFLESVEPSLFVEIMAEEFAHLTDTSMFPEIRKLLMGVCVTASATYVPQPKKSVASELSILAAKLPGVHKMVINPVTLEERDLFNTIINLNDTQGWSREKIADWLDEISDPTGETGPDLRFKAELDPTLF